MNKKNQSGGFIFFVLTILIIVGYTFYKEKELSDNKQYTKGRVIDYYNVGGKKYITYIFLVNNRKYTSKKRVYPFKCDDGTEGCVEKLLLYIILPKALTIMRYTWKSIINTGLIELEYFKLTKLYTTMYNHNYGGFDCVRIHSELLKLVPNRKFSYF